MMQQVRSIEELRTLLAEVRAKRQGFLTNFYLDDDKHSLWIEKEVCEYEWVSDTLFVVKKSETFWNVFYCSTTMEVFSSDLSEFKSRHLEATMMFDIVGRDSQCVPLVKLFEEQGFTEATSLVRMIRMTESMDYVPDSSIRQAKTDEATIIHQLLRQFFNEKTEQIPFVEELEGYAKEGHVLVCEESGNLAGFLIYEINATTIYLRYWFTLPDFRDKKVGSRLLRRFFEEGKNTKRQLFWVIRNNENAIKRYKHYGFAEENMYDFVMQSR